MFSYIIMLLLTAPLLLVVLYVFYADVIKPIFKDIINYLYYKKHPFSIKYFPLSGRYYPTYKGMYLKTNKYTEKITADSYTDSFQADNYPTKEEAEQAIIYFRFTALEQNIRIFESNSNPKKR